MKDDSSLVFGRGVTNDINAFIDASWRAAWRVILEIKHLQTSQTLFSENSASELYLQ